MSASKTKWVRLGDYIERSMANNFDLKYGSEHIEGVTSKGEFAPTKAQTIDINLKPYKLVNNGDFVYNPSRFNIGSIAYRKQGFCIVSHLYVVFRLTEYGKKHFHPEFLYMYIYREEFFRMIDYLNFGSQRPEFNFFELSDIMVPLPSIEMQRELVDTYNGLKSLAEQNEALIPRLSAVCQAYIVDCRAKYPSVPLGKYIEQSDERNSEEMYLLEDVTGISNEKSVIPTKADMKYVSLTPYKIFKPNEFCYVTVTSRNGGKISLALNNTGQAKIVSSSYVVFRSIDKGILLPEYLFLLFNRPEFDRYTRFNSWGSARETFDWNEMCRVQIPLPPIDVQQAIVDVYHCMERAKQIATTAREKLKTLCPALVQRAAHS
jgi:type I restriction enzyme S subunit